MKPPITVGTCGWAYLREHEFSKHLNRKFRSKLQAYAQIFPSVEVNSTFYRIPKLSTAEKWRREADEMNQVFEFTVKASKIITHVDQFASKSSVDALTQMLDICAALRAKVLLLQSPESFRPTEVNIGRLGGFFASVKTGSVKLAWEPRGRWWDVQDEIRGICERFKVICCVDPFRNELPKLKGIRTGYFRLHGFGTPSMYMYRFSAQELKVLLDKCKRLSGSVDSIRVFFNNAFMYENALEFRHLL